MMNGCYLVALGLLSLSSLVSAGDMGGQANRLGAGYFVGLGGSYNFSQDTVKDTVASLNAQSGFPPLGVFSGSLGALHRKAQSFTPEAQVGYFQQFSQSNWLWGVELFYQNSIKVTDNNNLRVNLLNIPENTTNEITLTKVQTKVNDAFVLPVFVGHSLNNGFIYLGGGPALFNIRQSINSISDNLSGFYIGTLGEFSNRKWILGGAVQAGITYYLNPSWFVKGDYTYEFANNYSTQNIAAFSPTVNGGLNAGVLTLNGKQGFANQKVALSINKVFSV